MLKAVAFVITALACATAHPPQRVAKLADTQGAAKILSPLWVGPGFSGSWFNPQRSGEGWNLQVLDNGTALMLWFTYPPAGSPAQQAWIYADSGRIEGDRIIFDTTYTTRGPRFGPSFNPALTQLIPWGRIEFRFTSCGEGEISYAGPAAWGSATRSIQKFTQVAELECAGAKRQVGGAGARTLAGLKQRSGLWFDPTHNGEGWAFEELPDGRMHFFWYTYDENGEQAWTNGVAATNGDTISIPDNLRPVGTRFGADFDATKVQRNPWGRVDVAFDGCNVGTLTYQSPLAAFGSGTLRPQRIARLAGTACLATAPTVPTNGTWTTAAPVPSMQSEVATVTHEGKTYIAGGFGDPQSFLRYDPFANTWRAMARLPGGRDHALAAAFGNEIFVTGGYANGGGDQANTGWRYDVAGDRWEVLGSLPQVAASGGTTLGGFVYFSSIGGELTQLNPRTRAVRTIGSHNLAPRDHSQMVAFQGELWLIAGRAGGITNSRVSIFDPASETWREGPALATTRSGFAAAASETLIFVAGGEVLSNPPRVVTTVEAIAAGQNAWSRPGSLPTPVHGVGGAIHGNAFYTFGGSTEAGTDRNITTVQVYRW